MQIPGEPRDALLPAPASLRISRRAFLVTGVLGAAALATAAWLKGPHAPASIVPRRALDADGDSIMAAIVPVLLAGALPAAPGERATAIAETLAAIDGAIAGLPPAAQKEIQQLFALLAAPPVRIALARIGSGWPHAAPDDVRRFLDRMRGSSWSLLRSAYDALHQLTFAAWYGNPRAWDSIGYSGPPEIAA